MELRHIVELWAKAFEITLINLFEKFDSEIENFSWRMETVRKNLMEILASKNIITEIKNAEICVHSAPW